MREKTPYFLTKLPKSRSKRQSINSVFVTLGTIKIEKQKLVWESIKHYFTMWVNKKIFVLCLFYIYIFVLLSVNFFSRPEHLLVMHFICHLPNNFYLIKKSIFYQLLCLWKKRLTKEEALKNIYIETLKIIFMETKRCLSIKCFKTDMHTCIYNYLSINYSKL